MLNPEERAALIEKASGLRTEISDLTAERDAARVANSTSVDDARLIAEVQGLVDKRDAALKERDDAVSATDAIALMQGLMKDRIPDEAKLEPQAVDAPVEQVAPEVAPVVTENKTKGGNR